MKPSKKLEEYKKLLSESGFALKKSDSLLDQLSMEFEFNDGKESFSLLCLPDNQMDTYCLGINILDISNSSRETLSRLDRFLNLGCKICPLVKFLSSGRVILGVSEFVSSKEHLDENLGYYVKNLREQRRLFLGKFEEKIVGKEKFYNLN